MSGGVKVLAGLKKPIWIRKVFLKHKCLVKKMKLYIYIHLLAVAHVRSVAFHIHCGVRDGILIL